MSTKKFDVNGTTLEIEVDLKKTTTMETKNGKTIKICAKKGNRYQGEKIEAGNKVYSVYLYVTELEKGAGNNDLEF